MQLEHHGGHEGVTGSCHQLNLESGRAFLVDCGIFQGADARRHPDLEIEFPLDRVDSLVLTHVHMDHVGRLPYLLSAGFTGKIFCTRPSAKLLPITMEDALKIGFTRKRRLIEAFLNTVNDLLSPQDFGVWFDICRGARGRFQPAGHVLGSAYLEVDTGDRRVVFSGDLGAPYSPLLKDPQPPERADLVVLESTYGDKLHQGRAERQDQLERVLRRTLDDRGVTLIPAFSLGRTQELLYELNGIFERIEKKSGSSLLQNVDVIVDSPLATRFTKIYQSLEPYWDAEAQRKITAGDQPLIFENLTTIGSHREHGSTLSYLDKRNLPAVVIAGSGMCTGGRVVNWLERLVDEKSTDILFCGYQAWGTPGRALLEGDDKVELDGKKYPVHAKVHTLSGYSAHADQANLMDFVRGLPEPPEEVVLVHGEDRAKKVLRRELEQEGYRVR